MTEGGIERLKKLSVPLISPCDSHVTEIFSGQVAACGEKMFLVTYFFGREVT